MDRTPTNVYVPAVATRPAPPPVIVDAEPIEAAPPPCSAAPFAPTESLFGSIQSIRMPVSSWFALSLLVTGGLCLGLVGLSNLVDSRLFLWPLMFSLFSFWLSLAGLMLSRAAETAWRLLSAHLPHQTSPGSMRSTVHSR